MSEYILSIIIPTKNRQFYCLKAIEQILNDLSENVEIIIQDNSDDDNLKNEIDKMNSPNIRYNYHEGILSFVDNFNEAISLSSGKYVCMIGDDDGVLPIIEDIAKYALEKNMDAFVPGLNVMYSWPSDTPFTKNAEKGYLYITPFSKKIRKLNISKALNRLLNKAFMDYQSIHVPRLYHGLVKKQKVEEISSITGNYFGGLTPDMYISVALSIICTDVYYSNFPITISGMCQGSGSAASATGAHTGELNEAPHFAGHTGYIWDMHIPYFYSVETIWAETALHALKDMNRSNMIEQVNYTYFLAQLKMKYPIFNNRIKNFSKEKGISMNYIKYYILKQKINNLVKRSFKLVTGYRWRSVRKYSIENIIEAKEYVCSIMDAKLK